MREVFTQSVHFDDSSFAANIGYIQKGFGEETPDLQQKIEVFFNKYGRTNAVRMRRMDDTKLFKVRSRLGTL